MELKETKSSGVFYGTLEEKNLEFDKDAKGNIVGIKGDIVVSDHTGSYPFRVYSRAKTVNGKENRLYAQYVKVMNEYISKAEATQLNALPTDVQVRYSIRPNNYTSRTGEVVTAINYQTIYVSKSNPSEIEEDSYLRITGSVIDMKKRENKEYSIVTIAVVDYNGGVSPIDLVVKTEDWDDIATQCHKGDTIEFITELCKEHVEVNATPKRKVAFGKAPKMRSGYDIIRPCIVLMYDPCEEGDEEYLPPEEIERGLIERGGMATNKKESGKSNMNTTAPNPEVEQIMDELTEDEIPF